MYNLQARDNLSEEDLILIKKVTYKECSNRIYHHFPMMIDLSVLSL